MGLGRAQADSTAVGHHSRQCTQGDTQNRAEVCSVAAQLSKAICQAHMSNAIDSVMMDLLCRTIGTCGTYMYNKSEDYLSS